LALPRRSANNVTNLGTPASEVLDLRERGKSECLNLATASIVGVVGPEGGFTAEEVARLEQWGARRTGLAPHVLRVETAAIALAAGLQAVAPSP
jgi:RsmE family RNA methyltransferase